MPSTPNAARMTGFERGPHERRRLRPVGEPGLRRARASASPGFGEPGLVNLVNACSRPPA